MNPRFVRPSRRAPDELRTISLEPRAVRYGEGSCLAKFGHTHVLCVASVETGIPGWLRGQNRGWITAEYGMLPRATHERTKREAASGRQSGRSQEIQRLIGRSLRAVVDLKALGERQITLDCDVIQADGGTRTAAITGAFVALRLACDWLKEEGVLATNPVTGQVAAISCGIVGGEALLDLDYPEDKDAEIDANFVLTGDGGLVEIQATGEARPFTTAEFDALLRLAQTGCRRLFSLQDAAIAVR